MQFLKVSLFSLALGFLAVTANAEESQLLQDAKDFFQPLPDKPIMKTDSKTNEAKIRLGKMLYFEPRLSKSGVFSCNSCHNLATAGVDNASFSTGHKWQLGGRNAPTVLNASLHMAQFWDGRAEDVEEQAQGPILNPIEMAATKEMVLKRISSMPKYVFLFQEAFPESGKVEKMSGDDTAEATVSYSNIANAIAAFERTLLTPSPFDDFLKGNENALKKKEKEGLRLFIDKGCVTCHNGVVIGGNSYQKFGLVNPPYEGQKDKGRFEVTKKPEDMYVFKVPSLRNIELTYPYFNDGSVWKLDEAIKIMAWAQLGIKLNSDEIDKIESFLESLTGKQPETTLPILPPSTISTPKPEHD